MSIYRSLNILYGIILKDHLDQFLKCYPYKITRSEDFRKRDVKIRLNFALIFLAHLKIIELWPWSILWSGERVLISKVQWITSNAVFGHPNILTQSKRFLCIVQMKTIEVGVSYMSHWVRIFSKRKWEELQTLHPSKLTIIEQCW